jgi:hypothetical protein
LQHFSALLISQRRLFSADNLADFFSMLLQKRCAIGCARDRMQMDYGIVFTEPVWIGLNQRSLDFAEPFPDRLAAELIKDRAGNPASGKLLKFVP